MEVLRGNTFEPQRNVKVNCNPFGCLLFIIAIILIVFVLTHIGPIWSDLSRVFGG
jgi:hypothetical protein